METNARYSGLSILNHWIAALLIVVMLALGLAAGGAESDAAEHYIMGIHIALGFFVMLFVLWRVAWRLYQGFPADPHADALSRYVGRATHWALLAVIAVQVVTGPLYLFTEGEGMDVFGWFTFYIPLESLSVTHEPAEEIHKLLGEWVLPILLGLHLLGGVRHYLGRRTPAAG